MIKQIKRNKIGGVVADLNLFIGIKICDIYFTKMLTIKLPIF